MKQSKKSSTCWVGFDLGGSKMMATVFDHAFNIVAFERKKTRGEIGMEAGLARMAKTIQSALDQAGQKQENLSGIGVGCPGPLDLDKGVIIDTPNIGWREVPVKAYMEKTFSCPAVIANDVDAGTYGEYRFGAARKARCVLGVFPGTGIGGACIYEGRIFRGRTGSCMELGHFPVCPQGAMAGPGRYGTLESMTSRLALASQAAMTAYRGQAPALMRMAGTNVADIKSGILARAIEEGDTIIEELVRRTAAQLGMTLAGVINLLAPDVVVLGGGLVEAMPALYLEEVKQALTSHAMPAYAKEARVVTAELGDNACVMGAAALVADAERAAA
jgi:glucokinase